MVQVTLDFSISSDDAYKMSRELHNISEAKIEASYAQDITLYVADLMEGIAGKLEEQDL